MLSIYQLSIPTPYPVGPVNAYLLKNEPLTLIDPGPNTSEAKKELKYKVESIGVKLDEIKRILLTHSHPDHYGLAPWLKELSGAEIYVHPYELRRMTGESSHINDRIPFISETGIPLEEREEVMGQEDKLPHPFVDRKDTCLLYGGEVLTYGADRLQVMHMPGHAPGHLCFYSFKEGHFLSGDFLLPHITPNPVLEPDPQEPSRRLPVLKQYLDGLNVLEQMDINTVWPGHGGTFSNAYEIVETGRRHHEKQFKVIKDILKEGEKSCYEISKTVYPFLKGWDVFMGISEIQAHLDFLLEQGKIKSRNVDGVVYFCLPGGNELAASEYDFCNMGR